MSTNKNSRSLHELSLKIVFYELKKNVTYNYWKYMNKVRRILRWVTNLVILSGIDKGYPF